MATLFGTNDSEQLVGSGAADTIFGAGGDDILIGSSGNDHIYGDSGNDVLIGGAGLDFLYGGEGDDVFNATGEGNDSLFGGMGNDIYNFVGPGDNVVEGPNQGIDTVRSSVSYTLGDNVESLILAGLGISGTGNSLKTKLLITVATIPSVV
jgi:Ca2+-binding RTX toxin-like protein